MDGATTGAVEVGLNRLASNVEAAISTDNGETWATPEAVFDGMTDGELRYYFPSIGVRSDGSIIAMCQKIDIETLTYSTVYRVYDLKQGWQSQKTVKFTGSYPVRPSLFGKIETTPSGNLVMTGHLSDIQYVFISEDGGATFDGTIAYNGGLSTSEATVTIVSEKTWLVYVRVDAVATLLQLKTTDGGATYSDMGQINMPTSSDYDSHDALLVAIGGVRYLALLIMSRNGSTPSLNPESIICKWARLDAVLSSASSFFNGEEVVVDTLPDLSGYPSAYMDPVTGQALLVYHRETAARAAQIEAIGINMQEIINGSGQWSSFTPVITGTSGSDPTLNIANGRVRRVGNKVTYQVDARVNGSMTVTSGIEIDVSDAGAWLFDDPLAVINAPVGVEYTKADTQDLIDVSVRADDGTSTFALWHNRQNLTRSQLIGSEVNSNFRVSFTAEVLVK